MTARARMRGGLVGIFPCVKLLLTGAGHAGGTYVGKPADRRSRVTCMPRERRATLMNMSEAALLASVSASEAD